jgi:hypothetical protein
MSRGGTRARAHSRVRVAVGRGGPRQGKFPIQHGKSSEPRGALEPQRSGDPTDPRGQGLCPRRPHRSPALDRAHPSAGDPSRRPRTPVPVNGKRHSSRSPSSRTSIDGGRRAVRRRVTFAAGRLSGNRWPWPGGELARPGSTCAAPSRRTSSRSRSGLSSPIDRAWRSRRSRARPSARSDRLLSLFAGLTPPRRGRPSRGA